MCRLLSAILTYRKHGTRMVHKLVAQADRDVFGFEIGLEAFDT